MSTIDSTVCPACGAGPGTLSIEIKLVANPIGSFSVGGAQMKVTARERPVMVCSACPLEHVGNFDLNKTHAEFPPYSGSDDER